MNRETRPTLSRLVEEATHWAKADFGLTLSDDEVEKFFANLLWGKRDFWAACMAGIITEQEVASALASHFHDFLVRKCGFEPEFEYEYLEAVSNRFERSIFGEK